MIQHKYRGKRKDNGQMAYGYYFADDGVNQHFIVPDIECTGGLIRHDQYGRLFIVSFVEVEPETVGVEMKTNERLEFLQEAEEFAQAQCRDSSCLSD